MLLATLTHERNKDKIIQMRECTSVFMTSFLIYKLPVKMHFRNSPE